MDIKNLRDNIDRIDSELTKLFQERMETAAQIAKIKQEISLNLRKEYKIYLYCII